MRQLRVRVPRGQGERVIAAAEARGGVNTVLEAEKGGLLLDLVCVYVSNREVERRSWAECSDFVPLVELLESPE